MGRPSLRIIAFGALAVCGAVALYIFHPANLPTADSVVGPAHDSEVAPSDAGGLVASGDVAPRASTNAAAAANSAMEPQERAPQQVPPQAPELTLQGVQVPPPLLESERAFAAEPIDSLWASATEAHILQEIAALAARPMFTLRVACRSTMCRLQVVEPDKARSDTRVTANGAPESVAALVSSMQELVTRSGLEARGAMSVPDQVGSRVLVAYFAREGIDAGVRDLTEAR